MSDARGWETRWSDAKEAELIELWSRVPQLSTADIGERMFGTRLAKNKVIGKAHRLHLPRRASPLVRHTAGWTEARIAQWHRMRDMGFSQRSIAKTLGVSQSWLQKSGTKMGFGGVNVRPRIHTTLEPLKSLEAGAVKPVPKVAPVASRAPKPLFKPDSYGRCCWVVGKARYCDEPITTRGPYCDAHRQLAYREKPTRTLQEVA